MMLNGTGAQLWGLNTGSDDNPSINQGGNTTFFFNTVPDRCPSGPLAYYLPVILLTITGNVVQSGTAGSDIYWDQLIKALITNVNLQNAWHGTPISANHILGSTLPLTEYISNGFRYGARVRPPISHTAGTYPFRRTVALTPAVSRLGRLMSSTAQLAKLFQQANLQIQWAPPSVLSGLSTGATFTSLACRASAVLVPRNELVLGTPVETIMHQMVAGSNSNAITIDGFGTQTMLTGVQNKGGVVYLGELTSVLGGVFDSEDVTFYNFAWRGQSPVYDIDGFVAMQQLGNLPNDRPQVLPSILAGGDAEFANYPYAMNTSDEFVASESTKKTIANLYAWNMVQGGNELDLTDVQTADSDQQYNLTVDGGFSVGAHLVVGMYAKAWQQTMLDDWLKQVTAGGASSLAAYVMGSDYATATDVKQRGPRTKHTVMPDNVAYLPWQMYRKETVNTK
jgi:hypothetical protein